MFSLKQNGSVSKIYFLLKENHMIENAGSLSLASISCI